MRVAAAPTLGRAVSAAVRHRGAASLDDLDVRRYDAFTCATPWFWARKTDVVLGFFANLREHDSSAFLATQSEDVCRSVKRRDIRIVCVVTNRMNNDSLARDTMMTMERWRVVLHFLERGRRIVHAGADMRFTKPLRCLYVACGARWVIELGRCRSCHPYDAHR